MSLPRITVVTPSFNQGPYLEATIRSVLDQGYPNLEYLIADGGSTDQSVEIIRKSESRLAWWCSEKDRGQSHAINKGFAKGTGDLYCYINSDDTLAPGSLMAAAEAYKAGHEFITGWVVLLEPDGGEWPQMPFGRECNTEWFISNPLCQQATYWAGRFTRELGPFREDLHYCFDYEFWMRIVFKGNCRPHMLKRCMGGFRMHPTSKTVSQLDRFDPEFRSVRAEYRQYLKPAEQQSVDAWYRELHLKEHRAQAWAALLSRNIPQARQHARAAWGLDRFSIQSWKLMYCAIRGR